MERKFDIPVEEMCKLLESEIRQEGVGYGSKDSLWLVSPRYFTITKEQLMSMAHTSYVLQKMRVESGEAEGPFYFRGDFIPLSDGRMAIAEYNETPVGEGEISALRRVYSKNLGNLDGFGWQFQDAAATVASLLAGSYNGQGIGVVIPKERMGYVKDYRLLAKYAEDYGVKMTVFDPDFSEEDLEGIEVIYRAFQTNDLRGWDSGTLVWNKYLKGQIKMFPQVPKLSSKEIMAKAFIEKHKWGIQESLPWTWLVKPDLKPRFAGGTFEWKSIVNGDFPVPLVLKMATGREGKQVIFSDSSEWKPSITSVLQNPELSTWVIQEDFSGAIQRFDGYPYLSTKGTIRYQNALGARLCFTMVGENSEKPVVADMDVSMVKGRLLHTTSGCVHLPVLISND